MLIIPPPHGLEMRTRSRSMISLEVFCWKLSPVRFFLMLFFSFIGEISPAANPGLAHGLLEGGTAFFPTDDGAFAGAR